MARVLLLAACVAVLAQYTTADGGNFGAVLIRGNKDPANCGGLDQACCIRRKGGKCKGAGLDCVPDGGGNPRCRACGSNGQWPCSGNKACDDGLTSIEIDKQARIRVCVPDPRPVPSDATAPVSGKDAKDKQKKKGKKDGDIGKKILGGACDKDNDCRKIEACVGGVCQPCGGQGGPCCRGKTPCKSYGEGSPPLVCEYNVGKGANACGVRDAEKTLV